MIYATSDLHGYPLRDFKRLLSAAGFGDRKDDFLYILGDVIDRNGDGGVETLDWLIDRKDMSLLRGNHEDMLLRNLFLFEDSEKYDSEALYLWLYNGGEATIDALTSLQMRNRERLAQLIAYIKACPLYQELTLPSGRIVLSHAGLGFFKKDRPLNDYSEFDLLWYRPALNERFYEDALCVFGHTPVMYYRDGSPARMLRTDTWIDIDTGAAAGAPHAPMILRLDDLTPTYADCFT